MEYMGGAICQKCNLFVETLYVAKILWASHYPAIHTHYKSLIINVNFI